MVKAGSTRITSRATATTLALAATLCASLGATLAAPARAQTVPAGAPGKAAFDEGVRLMRANDAGKAEKQFERAVAADDRNAVYHLWLGNAVGQQAQDASVLRQPFLARRLKAEFERAVALDPGLLDARDGLISFYMRAPAVMGGGEDKARLQQQEIAKRDAYRGHIAAANIATIKSDTTGAERELRAAIAAAPDSVRAVINLAQRQQAWGRVPAAFATLDEGLKRRPDDIALRFQVARMAAITGQQLPRAEQLLRALIAAPDWEAANLRPSKAAVHFRLGMVLEKSGRKPEAKESYERAIALDPNLQAAKDALAAMR